MTPPGRSAAASHGATGQETAGDAAVGEAPGARDGTPAQDGREDARGAAVWRGVARTLVVFLASRLFCHAALILGLRMMGTKSISGAYVSWDAGWYVYATQFGYPRNFAPEGVAVQSTIAFFPAFPLFARVVETLTPLPPLWAGVLASVLSGAAAVVLLWFLVRSLGGERMADRTVALFSFFPSTFALLLPYAEGLMLTCVIGSMLAMRARRWWLAGILAALATTTRPNAVLLGAAGLWEAVRAIKERREFRALAVPLMAPLGIVGYFAFLEWHTGAFWAWLRVEREGWGYADSDYGLTTIKKLSLLWDNPLSDLNGLLSDVSLIFAVAMIVVLIRKRAPGMLVVYAVCIVLLAFMAGGAPASRPRYLLSAFPLIVGLAWWTEKNEARYALALGGSATMLGIFIVLSTATQLAVF